MSNALKQWEVFKQTLPHQQQPYSKKNWGNPNHSLCSYQGKLKPAIAHHLVKIFVPDSVTMYDPFSGVGTIPFEAALNGKKAFGTDISPLAYVVSSAKVGRINREECFQEITRIADAIKLGKNYWVDTKKIYDNPYVYPVNPADLVFDTSQVDNWDSCPKIYRTYKTPFDIVNNAYYSLSDEEKEEILVMTMTSNTSVLDKTKDVVNGSTIEVLEHWGDLKLPDGKVLKNWHAVIVGRKFLVEFGKNERLINPFSYGAFITDPETKRGISPLYCVLSLAHLQEDLLNYFVPVEPKPPSPLSVSSKSSTSTNSIGSYF